MDKVRVFLTEALITLILIAVLVSELRPVMKDYLASRFRRLERFRVKWIPVRARKTRQNKNPESRSDSIGTETALVAMIPRADAKAWRARISGRML
ncbi:MAG: hypothetical protein KGL62_12310 [Bradyrhizobium sp.]|uniref:hypothetical protein n=1 Tax=Bradyrhizobium sp. TaxID=376 RepID=UPI0023941DF1|nr:hypothetical protein [Bradyrhizobium sp.]MDE2603136.1 hypothetical protein [Bradyrhizobium sp.]